VGTDRIETGGRWMKAGVAPVVLAGQALEAHQYIESLAEVGRALGGQPRQSQVRRLAVLAHQQADVRPAAELDGRMAEAHEARNADARERTGEHFRRNTIAPQQG